MTYFYTDRSEIDIILQGNFPDNPSSKVFVLDVGFNYDLGTTTNDFSISAVGDRIFKLTPSTQIPLFSKFNPATGVNYSQVVNPENFILNDYAYPTVVTETVLDNNFEPFVTLRKNDASFYEGKISLDGAVVKNESRLYNSEDAGSAGDVMWYVPSLNISAMRVTNTTTRLRFVHHTDFSVVTVNSPANISNVGANILVSEFYGKVLIGSNYNNEFYIYDPSTKTSTQYFLPSGQKIKNVTKCGKKYLGVGNDGSGFGIFVLSSPATGNIVFERKLKDLVAGGFDRDDHYLYCAKFYDWCVFSHRAPNGGGGEWDLNLLIDKDFNVLQLPLVNSGSTVGGFMVGDDAYLVHKESRWTSHRSYATKIGKIVTL